MSKLSKKNLKRTSNKKSVKKPKVKVILVKKQMSDDEIKDKEGEYFDENHYN